MLTRPLIVHLLVTLTTDSDLGVARLLPPGGTAGSSWVSLAILVMPWVLGFSDDATARIFYLAAAVVIFVVWVLTSYHGRTTAAGDLGASAHGREPPPTSPDLIALGGPSCQHRTGPFVLPQPAISCHGGGRWRVLA
jgi:hypothetical protein